MKKKKLHSLQQPIEQKVSVKSNDLLDRWDQFFSKHKKFFLYTALIFATLFSLLLFNPQISESGDDSSYIERAYYFIHEGMFPSFQGPLYPMVLSIFVALFGVKVFLLKIISLFCIVGSLYFLYKAFENIVSPFILGISILLLSICSSVLFYSSQTFTEAFFMLLQAIIFYILLQKIDINKDYSLKKDWGRFLWLGGFVFLLGITKNVAVIAIVPVVGYFIVQKKWKYAAYTTGFFGICFLLLLVIKKFIFHISSDSSQLNMLLAKDPYNVGLGRETLGGFVTRFFENMNIYFNYLYDFLNLKSEETMSQPIIFLTIFICLLLIALLYFIFKKEVRLRSAIFFSLSYVLIMAGSSFIILQTLWQQDRLILVFFPILLLLCLLSFYYLFKLKTLKGLQWVMIIFVGILCVLSFKKTMVQVQAKNDVLLEALNGNDLYTYTSDWQNYLIASRWVSEHIPDTAKTACRKSSMSFIISGGKKNRFYGIYGVPSISIKNTIHPIDTNQNKLLVVPINQTPQEWKQYILAISVVQTSSDKFDNFFVCTIPKNIAYTQNSMTPFDKWYQANESKNMMFYSPDSLMNTLRKNNVQYVLLANLLMNPMDEKDNSIINTLHRYFSYIQVKYPYILAPNPVYSVGNTRDGSMVFKVNYPPNF